MVSAKKRHFLAAILFSVIRNRSDIHHKEAPADAVFIRIIAKTTGKNISRVALFLQYICTTKRGYNTYIRKGVTVLDCGKKIRNEPIGHTTLFILSTREAVK